MFATTDAQRALALTVNNKPAQALALTAAAAAATRLLPFIIQKRPVTSLRLAAAAAAMRVSPVAQHGRAAHAQADLAEERPPQMLAVTVNGRSVQVPAGSTLLDAIHQAGARVPVLCYHPSFKARAVCRMCLVDIEGHGKPLPACYTKAEEGQAIVTDTAELRKYRRGELEFLLARHPNECMRCEVSGSCKFQDMIQEEKLEDKWPKVTRGSHHADSTANTAAVAFTDASADGSASEHAEHALYDHSSPAISRDMSKCVECGLCVDACGSQGQNLHVIGFADRGFGTLPVTVFDKPLADSGCISCGQCTLRCPVGALTERPDWQRVLTVLDAKRRKTVVQTAPATRIAIGEEFGFDPGTVSTGRMVAALRALGFDYVFDTNFSADLTIMEEANELIERVQRGRGPLPMFTSCCPGWVNYVEIYRPDLIPHLSTAKSPQQMHAAVSKRGPFAKRLGPAFEAGEEEPFVVSVMPCTGKKDEAVRPGLRGDVDAAITTRELARMIRHRKIPFASLPNDEVYDSPLGESSGAGMIFGASGGVMEAALRTATDVLGMQDAPLEFKAVRGVEAGVKVATLPKLGSVAVVNSIGSAVNYLNGADQSWREHLMIEVMACKGGCLGGGGEPKSDDPHILQKRAKGVYRIDETAAVRKSHENTEVQRLYEQWLGKPLSHKAHLELHTSYAPRKSPREALARFLDAMDRRDGKAAARSFAADGVWQTQSEAFGEVRGAKAVAAVVSARLPPNPGRHVRHTFAGPEGLEVHTPEGETVRFEVELDPAAPHKMRRLTQLVG